MNKTLLIILMVSLITVSVSHAQDMEKMLYGKTVKGIVESISEKKLEVLTDEGVRESFIIDDDTYIYMDEEIIPFEQIKKDDRVTLDFDLNDDGSKIATWIDVKHEQTQETAEPDKADKTDKIDKTKETEDTSTETIELPFDHDKL
ncbi:MAG: hypothetical protein P9M03_03600 [Candidatus Theseobacter exili]|nr:hypothetical protein [Candidatus Theseobacter exili]